MSLMATAKKNKALPEDYAPSDDEPFMNELQRAYFRRKLLNWRDEILRSTKETLQHLQNDSEQHADIADRATSESERALELRARDRQRKLISKIDEALARIEDGTYGYCEETGEPIGLKRLDARPIATLSVEAQERHERRERVYRDE
ncbi:MAG: RNA polymerase-binding transcription factor DksA [Methyloceanibacter sp.]|nr:MAG: RNA polymerase-binding transcription factor DksA [Methyloceanibacter sp.]